MIPIHTDPYSACGAARPLNYTPAEQGEGHGRSYKPLRLDRVPVFDQASRVVITRMTYGEIKRAVAQP